MGVNFAFEADLMDSDSENDREQLLEKQIESLLVDNDFVEECKPKARRGRRSQEALQRHQQRQGVKQLLRRAKLREGTNAEPGWTCGKCLNFNFAGRANCNRCDKERSSRDCKGIPKHLEKTLVKPQAPTSSMSLYVPEFVPSFSPQATEQVKEFVHSRNTCASEDSTEDSADSDHSPEKYSIFYH